MTARTRAALKLLFETDDVPTAVQYGDLIDSCVNLVDTTAQSLASNVTVSGAAAGVVCAVNLFVTKLTFSEINNLTTLSASNVRTSAFRHRSPHAYMWLDTSVTYAGSLSPQKVAGPTTAHPGDLKAFTHTASNRLTYTGNQARMMVMYNLAVDSGGLTTEFIFQGFIAKNGVLEPDSMAVSNLESTPLNQITGSAIVDMVSGDYVEIWSATSGSAAAITLRTLSMAVYPVSWIF